jgi:hypothetical protein
MEPVVVYRSSKHIAEHRWRYRYVEFNDDARGDIQMKSINAKFKRVNLLGPLTIVAMGLLSLQAQAQITSSNYLCNNRGTHYTVMLDGDYYHAYFWSAASGKKSYLTPKHRDPNEAGGQSAYLIRFGTTTTPVDPKPRVQQNVVAGRTGPGYIGVNWDYRHRIVFWVDFNNTPTILTDDQRFDGYLMTHKKVRFAGITWKNGAPVGFTFGQHHCL